MSDKFVDERVPKAREARAMARQYNQLQDGLAELKVAHKVADYMGQSERQEQLMQDVEKTLVASEKLETDMLELFAELKNVRFLSTSELAMLPVSVLEAMGVDIENEEESEQGGE